MIVAVPSPTAITLPSLSTFTTPGASDSKMSFLLVASSFTLTSRFSSLPFSRVKSSLAVSSFTGVLTVTVTFSLTVLLSFDVTVIIAVPSPTATILPSSSTVTTVSSLDS